MRVLRDCARPSGLSPGGQVGMKAARALALTPCPSQLDGLIHRFITLLADTSDSRASESRVADASMACRKLAVAHPLLLLRYCLSVQPGVSPPPARGGPHTWCSCKNGLCGSHPGVGQGRRLLADKPSLGVGAGRVSQAAASLAVGICGLGMVSVPADEISEGRGWGTPRTRWLWLGRRHLPMIAALLHGRTHLNFQEFRQQNHLTFFMHVLGVLELLQPQVFQSEHQGALWDCLLSFVRLLRVGAPPPPLPRSAPAAMPRPPILNSLPSRLVLLLPHLQRARSS